MIEHWNLVRLVLFNVFNGFGRAGMIYAVDLERAERRRLKIRGWW